MFATPEAVRLACRAGEFSGQTSGKAPGYAQANICILPKEYAFDFLLFCQRNPKPCPLLHVLEAGCYTYGSIDIRTDLPQYKVFISGEIQAGSITDISSIWRDDFVTFIIGCSFSFEEALQKAGLAVRHIDEKRNVPMYKTNVPCTTAGAFHGQLVVSMRPYSPADAVAAIKITSRYPRVHGAPVHFGDPSAIGIRDLSCPEYGEAVSVRPGEVPVFWACGVTPQAVAVSSRPSICITHAPGHMLVLDDLNESLASF